MRLSDFFRNDDIIPELAATTREQALEELIDKLLTRHADVDQDEVLRLLLERERLGSTGIGAGIAIPHAKLQHMGKPRVIFGRSKTGIAYDALDGRPVHLFFLLVADTDSVDVYLKLLARLSRLLKDRALRGRLLEATDADSLYAIIGEQDSRI
jgi:PTS system nitrogen regulatory IIA component